MGMSEIKLVTCIIPTHNRASMLKEAVQSARDQTHKNLEIIIINDGSNDNTEYAINELKRQDPRIISLKNDEPQGASAARNIGIKKAKGAFIAFLDDDDQWLHNRISDALDFFKDYDVSLCSSIFMRRGIIRHYGNGLMRLDDFRKGNFFGGASVLMGYADVFKNNNFDEELSLGEDWDLYIRLAKKYRIGFIDKPLVLYNDMPHRAITRETINLPIDQLEKRLAAIYKNKIFLGKWWTNYHIADRLLSYFRFRDKKIKHIFYAVRRCGFLAVLRSFIIKIERNICPGGIIFR